MAEFIDEAALVQYLDRHLSGPAAPITLEKVGTGHSNLTFLVQRGSQNLILRRPPPGPLLPTTHDMVREYAFLTGLVGSAVPVPRPILFCEDTSILGVNFYLMEYLPGVVITSKLPPALDNTAGRASLTEVTIQTLAAIHAVDFEAAGLTKIGKPAGYMERQVRRRMEQLAQTIQHTRPLPLMEQVGEWLSQHLPPPSPAGIVHGDFRIDNMIFAPEFPARPLGVLDWETATLGDPLVDLGYLLAFWVEKDDPPVPWALSQITRMEGFPGRAEITRRYAQLTGRNLDYLAFYEAFSLWKLAISLEGGYARYLAGMNDDPFYAAMKEYIPAMAERAWALCQEKHL